MYDGQEELNGRLKFLRNDHNIEPNVVQSLKEMLDRENSLVKIFHFVRDRFQNEEYIDAKLRLVANRETDGRESNIPANAYEFAGLVPGDNFENPRDIVIEYKKSRSLKRISTIHPSYMALQYPLLFPYGEDGYRVNIMHRGISVAEPNKRNTVTMREYYAYRLQHRHNEGHALLKGGRLFLQFIVDAWTSIEYGRLSWVTRGVLGPRYRGFGLK